MILDELNEGDSSSDRDSVVADIANHFTKQKGIRWKWGMEKYWLYSFNPSVVRGGFHTNIPIYYHK